MALPTPELGLVLNYAYLWHEEYLAGREEGIKNRPSVIVLSAVQTEDGSTWVTVLPITHSAPKIKATAIEIPPAIKKHLGLDEDQSWIVISEGNEFIWPGYDLRKRRGTEIYDYGFLPPRLFIQVRDAFVKLARESKVKSSLR